MITTKLLALIGFIVAWQDPRQRERGLSQSTENAILLAGAVAVATAVIVAITAYVTSHLPK